MSEIKKKIYCPEDDQELQKPFIDKDEWCDRAGYRIRMVHGGFEGTNVKFQFCFPQKEMFKGRFFQYVSPAPGPDEECASLHRTGVDDRVIFAVSHGAYFVESNLGSFRATGLVSDATLKYRSSAAAAEYSRKVAMEMYGCSRPFGYAYGGSGGGFKTMGFIENTNAFDGAVPFVIGSPLSLPNVISIRSHGMRILRHVIPQIMDAIEPGGSGDPYEGLNEEEQDALREQAKLGFPMRAWLQSPYMDMGSLPVLAPIVKQLDPDYFEDFWTVPGYLGADPNGSARRERILMETSIKEIHIPSEEEKEEAAKAAASEGRNNVDDAWKKGTQESFGKTWITVNEMPGGDDLYIYGCNLTIKSGEAEGSTVVLDSLDGDKFIPGSGFGLESVNAIVVKAKPGDKVLLDNSDYIAVQTYHRHQVPELEYTAWDQFRDENKQPIYPQRSRLIGPVFAFDAAGAVQDGHIQGKVIVVAALEDESAFPWQADWYRRKVASANPGMEKDIFRLWFMEHSNHGDYSVTPDDLHIAPYIGALHQALLSVSDWVERRIIPCESTVYTIDDGQVIPAATAKERKGVQPVITLTVNGSDCVRVKPGAAVSFEAYAEVPDNGGKITSVDFSFEGETDYPEKGRMELMNNGREAVVRTTHTYKDPGVYYGVVRVKSNLDGNAEDNFTQIVNLARVRVIVE